MDRLAEAKNKVRDLSRQALDVVDNPKLDTRRQKAALDRLEPQIDAAMAEVQSWTEVAQKRSAFFRASQPGSAYTYPPTDGGGLGQPSAAPGLAMSEDQLRGLHDAVLSHKSFKVEVGTKDTVSAQIPASLMPGITPMRHEPNRIADLIPSTAMGTPVIEYLQHLSTTGTAGMVAAGTTKPSVALNVTKLEARARKIAVTTSINDEDLTDFAAFASYVSSELQRLVIDQENAQILTGDGTGENLLGLLSTTGILTRVKGAAPETGIDSLELAANDLRTGSAFTTPSLYAMHPNTWSGLRLAKDTQGRYLLGNPTEADTAKLWGVPVVLSTQFAAGTVAVLDAQAAAQLHWRQGLIIQTDFGRDGFEKNQTSFRCEERVALAVPRPAAIVKVTGL